MTGIVIAGGGTGGIIVPPVVNRLISIYGWRNAYTIMGATVLVILILVAQFLVRLEVCLPEASGQELSYIFVQMAHVFCRNQDT